jgi:cyclopropane-fatty-acyl-phospholipid synthase
MMTALFPSSSELKPVTAPLSGGRTRASQTVLKLLKRLPKGRLDLQLPDGTFLPMGQESHSLRAQLTVKDWRVFERVLAAGDIGFAESFIEGQWSTPDLAVLLNLMIANRQALEGVVYGSWWGALLYRLRHVLRRNSRAGSQKNIHAHYDLGNDFYRLWLDPTMSYSSAWFEGDQSGGLVKAQWAKVDRALQEAGVHAGSRVLEVGCGWGGVAERAAQRGAHLVGVTLSREQLVWAQNRVERAGCAERCDLRYQDYRDLPAQYAQQPFDAIVSIEMFEAVGQSYWPGYFDMIKQCLKPGGSACIQTITIRDDLFDRYAKSTDFIQQYIFPGGLLPSVSQFKRHAAKAGLAVTNELAFGGDYAETLRRWRADFLSQDRVVREQGFDTRFMRTWEFYLAYCEAAFDQGNTDVLQLTLRHA